MASKISVIGGKNYGDISTDEAINGAHSDIPSNPYGYTSSGLAYLVGNGDSYVNAYNQQKLWEREDALRKLAESREDTEMDRLFEAARRNGVNPVLLLDHLAGATGNAASYSTSAAKTSNYDENAKTAAANSAKLVGALIAALGMIAAAAL